MSFWHFDFLFCTSEKNYINTLLLIVVGQIPTVFTMNSVTFIRVVFAIILIPSPLINFFIDSVQCFDFLVKIPI